MSAVVRAGYKLTEGGVIPDDWEALTMSKLFQLKQGVQCPVERQSAADGKGLRRFIRIVDLTNPKEDWRYIADPGSAHHLEMTDLFMVRYGSPGLVGLGYSGVVANNLFRLIPRRNIEGHFYYQYLAQRQEEIAGLSGSSTMPAVSFSTLNHFYVVSPPLQEQRAIATALSDVDALLAKQDALIAKKRDFKVASMQQLLTGQTRLPGFSGEWEVKRLGDVVRITTGKKDVNEGNPAGQYPFFTCARAHTFSDNFSFDCEAILIAGNGEVGNLNYFNGRFEAYQRTYVLQNFAINVSYLWHQLTAHLVQSLGIGTIGSSIPYIKMENLVGFEFQSPIDALEQTAIASVLSDMDTELTALVVRRDKTRALKQGMMQELLTGRIRLVASGD